MSRDDQQHAILQVSGLAADCCSLSLTMGRVDVALQQLEFGRGLILGYLIDSRSDMSDLRKDCPSLADSYDTLRFRLSRTITAEEPAIRDQMMWERREAARELEHCLQRIRQQDGYSRFLLEPSVEELKKAAEEGPVIVVNATDIGSHAIIVSNSSIKAIPLPGLTALQAPLQIQRAFRKYRSINETPKLPIRDIESDIHALDEYDTFLSWLWLSCVSVVLDELGIAQSTAADDLPRIWWIGTGVASSLPFHAAGYHSTNPLQNTLHYCIPSYTPTIKALNYSRQCASRSAQLKAQKRSVLLVTMPETPGQKPLYGVTRERLVIQEALGDVYSVENLEYPTAEQVVTSIKKYDIAHFACHGSSDGVNPSNSHLLLQKNDTAGLSIDPLTVSRISNEQSLGRAWIAYLSACSTAEVKAQEYADEGLHLASAFQVAGFGHVIGSLWSADDEVCVQVARCFYRYLLSRDDAENPNRVVAEALRDAVLQIRSDFPQDPVRWGPYIHSGA